MRVILRLLVAEILLLTVSTAFGTNMASDTLIQRAVISTVAPVDNAVYKEQCGGCHFAFQPGLLPTKSWEALLDGLANHFGENAELHPAELDEVRNYLMDNAADRAATQLGSLISNSIPSKSVALRITKTPYFKAQHQLLDSVVMDSIGNSIPYSNCIACHPGAEAGEYNEDETAVPGVKNWKSWHFDYR